MPIIDVTKFKALGQEITDSGGSHGLFLGTLEGSTKTWYCKQMRDPAAAKEEVLAQEFFRLLIPHQPETLLATDKHGTHYILSESVEGYHDLPQFEEVKFSNGTFTGLGQALVGSMFLQEVDLKNGNIGLDNQNRVIKIDGDKCFSAFDVDFKAEPPFKLSPKAIASLPCPVDFPTFEWLDYVIKWRKSPFTVIVPEDLSESKQFRSEVNQALLKICLLPDQYIDAYTNFYMPSEGGRYIDLIKSRRDELTQSALQNESFQDYLQTQEAKDAVSSLLEQVKNLKSGGMFVIPDESEIHELLTTEIHQKQSQLYSMVLHQKCDQIIGSLKDKLNPMDALLKKFISDTIDGIEENKNNPVALQKFIENVEKAVIAMDSDEFNEVKKTIALFRAEIGIFMKEKADKIERALYNTPISERNTLISNPVANDVQREMASHRHPFRDSAELPGGQIDYEKAAANFKRLKDKFKQVADELHNPDESLRLK